MSNNLVAQKEQLLQIKERERLEFKQMYEDSQDKLHREESLRESIQWELNDVKGQKDRLE